MVLWPRLVCRMHEVQGEIGSSRSWCCLACRSDIPAAWQFCNGEQLRKCRCCCSKFSSGYRNMLSSTMECMPQRGHQLHCVSIKLWRGQLERGETAVGLWAQVKLLLR